MGRMNSFEVLPGDVEFALNAKYDTEGFTFNRFASYVTTNKFGKKVVKAGTPVPANDATCIGLALKTYDLEEDNFNGAIFVKGTVIESKLPVVMNANAKAALKNVLFR